jgi:TonB family protein
MKPIRLCVVSAATCAILLVAAVSQAAEVRPSRLVIRQTDDSRFPASLLAEGITEGEVWIVVSVDPEGQLTDALVSRYTHRALANEAMRLLRRCKFDPVRVAGQAVDVCTEVKFTFEATGCVLSLDPHSTLQQLIDFANAPSYHEHLCKVSELDRVPAATRTVSPYLPSHQSGANVANGKALLEFIIDEMGRARMPVLVSADDPHLGNLAAAALTQWEFTPPTREGRPAAVWVRQEFFFPKNS